MSTYLLYLIASNLETMMKLIFHIGLQKTGTSSIQHFLHHNRDALLADGLIYPRLTDFSNVHFSGISYHNSVAAALSKISSTFPKLDEHDISSLKIFISQSKKTVILSAEDFSRILDLEKVIEFTKEFETTIVVYLREQTAWLQSMYNQRNKILLERNSEDLFDESLFTQEGMFSFIKEGNFMPITRFDEFLYRWSKVSPDLRVRLFSKADLMDGDLIKDFMHTIGVHRLDAYTPAPQINENVANGWLAFLRRIDAEQGRDAARGAMRAMNDLSRAGEISVTGNTGILNEKAIAHIRAQYADINKRVALQYFGRDTLFR